MISSRALGLLMALFVFFVGLFSGEAARGFGGCDTAAPGTMILVGPFSNGTLSFGDGDHWQPGRSSGVTYSGGRCDGQPIPAFAVTDGQVMNWMLTHTSPNVNIDQPGVSLAGVDLLPWWLHTPGALGEAISNLRVHAQHSGRYFNVNGGHVTSPPFYYTNVTGITFCEGDCRVGDGGGILVVTGKLTNTGNFRFRGLIIVVGEGGWARTGGGQGAEVAGNVVIAPYIRADGTTSSTFLPPSYTLTGGGSVSTVLFDGVNSFW
jgi:hypothetical protein